MRRPRVRLTTRRAMALVALGGLSLAASRHDPAMGTFLAGASGLALIRASERIDRSRVAGSPMTPPRRVAILLASLAVASAMPAAAGLPAWIAFEVSYGLTPAGLRCGRPTEFGSYAIPLAVATLVALPSARLVKQAWW